MRRHRPSSAAGSSSDKAEQQRGLAPLGGPEQLLSRSTKDEGSDIRSSGARQEPSEASTSGAQQLQTGTPDALGMATSSWRNLPARTKIVVASSMAFFFSNLVRRPPSPFTPSMPFTLHLFLTLSGVT